MFELSMLRLFVGLTAMAARILYARNRPDPDGEIEWLEGGHSDNGWALWELESRRYDYLPRRVWA